MSNRAQHRTSNLRISGSTLTFSLATLVVAAMISTPAMQAQTFTVLYTFSGEHSQDGAHPMSGVVMDRAGNLYGATFEGGTNGGPGEACFTINDNGGCGTVFKLAKHGSSWIYSQLYKFQAAPDGNFPNGITLGPDGTLYGTTYGGGFAGNDLCNNFFKGCGIAFRLQPQPNICPSISCPWNETVLRAFTGQNGDGAIPNSGDLVFDHAGNIYGTTGMGGATNYGTAYQLMPEQGGWNENVVFNFDPSNQNVANPNSGLIMDQAGNFYGSGSYDFGGNNPSGSVYQLVPSQSGWTLHALQTFECVGGLNGCYPNAPIFDAQGNLVVSMDGAGFYGQGTAIKLVASDNWSIDLLYTFTHGQGYTSSRLTMDAAGNLYGVASNCATGNGCIYKLTPSSGDYTFTDLYDFTGGTDGEDPSGPVTIDANGNLYGTAQNAGNGNRCIGEGQGGCGTVWEFTP